MAAVPTKGPVSVSKVSATSIMGEIINEKGGGRDVQPNVSVEGCEAHVVHNPIILNINIGVGMVIPEMNIDFAMVQPP